MQSNEIKIYLKRVLFLNFNCDSDDTLYLKIYIKDLKD